MRTSFLSGTRIVRIAGATVIALALVALSARAQVTKGTIAGVTNYSHVETTIACAGATTPGAMSEIKRLGYASVINLRQDSEAGANLEDEAAAAKAADLIYIRLPFNGASPDPKVAEQFVEAVSAPVNQPAFVHCASGNRAAALWMIKRMTVDGWDADRASAEATALGLTNAGLKTFALDYAASHKK